MDHIVYWLAKLLYPLLVPLLKIKPIDALLSRFSDWLHSNETIRRWYFIILSVVALQLALFWAWDHRIPGLCFALLLLIVDLGLIHYKPRRHDDDGDRDNPDGSTPYGDAIDAWLRRNSLVH